MTLMGPKSVFLDSGGRHEVGPHFWFCMAAFGEAALAANWIKPWKASKIAKKRLKKFEFWFRKGPFTVFSLRRRCFCLPLHKELLRACCVRGTMRGGRAIPIVILACFAVVPSAGSDFVCSFFFWSCLANFGPDNWLMSRSLACAVFPGYVRFQDCDQTGC